MISKELLFSSCEQLGIRISERAADRFDEYAKLLVDYNSKVNLTAITAPDDIVIKHFVDSLCLNKFVPLTPEKRIIDVGTGAGFPGAALLCAEPSLNITMIDSVNKKLDFIRFLLKELGLEAEIITIRAEDAAKKAEFREKFDVVTSRAVAALNVLAEYSVPLVKVGGVFSPLKAVLSAEEDQRGCSAAANLGAKVISKYKYSIPDGSEREIIVAEKISQTSPKYPRAYAQISKKPL
ncbi:MAG: 16S rRNA (guanine(527)-N(7))-methyltransferase RsmG [Clostridia bacterium]|nr:16S rRNA (guanine(527)-N(7))-methyltransferase RsmG [Clostridia bacterium]